MRVSPAVGQIEGDAAADGGAEAHVPDGAQADIEEGDDAHPQVEHADEALRSLHLVLQGENLHDAHSEWSFEPRLQETNSFQ